MFMEPVDQTITVLRVNWWQVITMLADESSHECWSHKRKVHSFEDFKIYNIWQKKSFKFKINIFQSLDQGAFVNFRPRFLSLNCRVLVCPFHRQFRNSTILSVYKCQCANDFRWYCKYTCTIPTIDPLQTWHLIFK